MLKPMLALLFLSAAPVAAAQETATPARSWALTAGDGGCMAYAGSSAVTVLSISATPAQDALLFVVQNPQWDELEDGERYPIGVEFDDMGPWQIEAVAQRDIDSDGPGLLFIIRPGREDGARFMREFSEANSVSVGHDGAVLDNVSLMGSEGAMAGMARCIGSMWTAGSDTRAPDEEPAPAFATEEPPVDI